VVSAYTGKSGLRLKACSNRAYAGGGLSLVDQGMVRHTSISTINGCSHVRQVPFLPAYPLVAFLGLAIVAGNMLMASVSCWTRAVLLTFISPFFFASLCETICTEQSPIAC
jgi:hypothetical protein